MHLQQTIIENRLIKGENAPDEQFLPFPYCFELCLIIILSLIENVHSFVNMFSICALLLKWLHIFFILSPHKNKSVTEISKQKYGKISSYESIIIR